MRNIAALFSILMPGFGQIYNGQVIKGVTLLIIEHFNNVFGNINYAVHLDFNGFHQQAIEATNFQYMLFYPGFYAYTVWDAWYYAKPNANKTTTAIPFFIGGILGEIGAIYGNRLQIPTLTVGMLMIIPMICGMVVFKNLPIKGIFSFGIPTPKEVKGFRISVVGTRYMFHTVPLPFFVYLPTIMVFKIKFYKEKEEYFSKISKNGNLYLKFFVKETKKKISTTPTVVDTFYLNHGRNKLLLSY